MRKLSLSPSVPMDAAGRVQWLIDSMFEVQRASIDADMGDIVKVYSIVNPPASPVRTLDVATATVGDLAAFVATFIGDLQKGGTNRAGV